MAYAAPSLASAGLALPIFALMPKFYSDQMLAPLGLIAVMIALARAFDAITDPAMGWISDRVSTRWGRRRPWIVLGVPFTAVSMMAMFGPPDGLTPNTASLWFGLTFAAYFLFHTIYFVPYQALGFELTLDYHERSSLFGWNQAFALAGNVLAGASLFLVTRFDEERTGYLLIGVMFSLLLTSLFGWLVARVRERPDFVKRESNPLVPGVRRSLRNRPFRILLFAYAIFNLTGAIPATVAPFYIPYVLRPSGDTLFGISIEAGDVLATTIVLYVLVGALSIPLWVWLAHRVGKLRAWYVSIWIGILGSLGFFFLGEGDVILFFALIVFVGTGLGAGLLHPAMQADVIDYDELHTGKRREAQYSSFWAIVPKFVSIPSAAVPLAVLAASGYVAGQPEQPPAVLFTLRALLGLANPMVSLIAFFIVLRFPMSEAVHREVLAGIDQHRRGETARDPLTGLLLPPPNAREITEESTWFLDYFSRGELERVLRRGPGSALVRVARSAAVCLLGTVAITGWVVNQLGDLTEEPGILVTLGVVAAGFALSGLLFHVLRLRPALRMRRNPVDPEVVRMHLHPTAEVSPPATIEPALQTGS